MNYFLPGLSLHFRKDFPAAWMNLGIVLASTKRLEESQNAYKTALQYRKNYPDCFYNLGNLVSRPTVHNYLYYIQFTTSFCIKKCRCFSI